MLDTTPIKDLYSRMTDEQLTTWAATLKQQWISDVNGDLRQEFLHRNLDISIFENNWNDKIVHEERNRQRIESNVREDDVNSIWSYVYSEKEARKTDGEIYNGLINRGIDENIALIIIGLIETNAKQTLAKFDKDVSTGALILIAGIAIAIWKYSSIVNGGVYIAALGAIIVGVFLVLRAITSKSKYKTIVANIEAERALAPNITILEEPLSDTDKNDWTTTTPV